MKAHSVDQVSLDWVQNEISKTINEAQKSLEAYLDKPENTESLADALAHLREVGGPVKMMGMESASTLIEEMQDSVKYIIENRDNNDILLDALLSSTLLLPNYLSLLSTGAKEQGVILLDVLSKLREGRNGKPVNIGKLLSDEFLVELDKVEIDCQKREPSSYAELSKKARNHFQVGLLNYIKGVKVADALARMKKATEAMKVFSSTPYATAYWALAEALVTALGVKSTKYVREARNVAGTFDRSMKISETDGEKELSRHVEDDVIKSMIFLVLTSSSDNNVVHKIKALPEFKDANLLVDELKVMSKRLTGSEQELITSISAEVKGELAQAIDVLDIYGRSNSKNNESLKDASEKLQSAAGALNLIGQDELGETLLENAKALSLASSKDQNVDDTTLSSVAEAIVTIDSYLASAIESGTFKQDQSKASQVDVALVQAVATEVLKELAQYKDTLLSCIDENIEADEGESQALSGVLGTLAGSVSMLQQEKLSRILRALNEYVEQNIVNIEKQMLPSKKSLDYVADVLIAAEYYITAKKNGSLVYDDVLEKAIASLSKLGVNVHEHDAEEGVESQAAEATVQSGESENHANNNVKDVVMPEHLKDMPDEGHATQNDEVVEKLESNSVTGSYNSIDSNESAVQDSKLNISESESVTAEANELEVGLSDDMKLFKEEAAAFAEQLNNIDYSDLKDQDVSQIKAAYHTLEGSSKLVGAESVSIIAESVKATINTTEVNKLNVADVLATPLHDCAKRLNTMIIASKLDREGFKEAQDCAAALECAVENYMQSQGGGDTPVQTEDNSRNNNSVEIQAKVLNKPEIISIESAQFPEGVDDDIAEIFIEEAMENIEILLENLPSIDTDSEALQTIRRSYHTLKGSGRMAGANRLGEYAWSVENMLNRVLDDSISLDSSVINCVTQATNNIPSLLNEFMGGDRVGDLIEEISSIADAISTGAYDGDGLAQHAPIDDNFNNDDLAPDETEEDEANSQLATDEVDAEIAVNDTINDDSFVDVNTISDAHEENKDATATESEIDYVLLDIFKGEASRHIDSLQNYLELCANGESSCAVTDEQIRSLHTVQGSARTAGVIDISEVISEYETLFNRTKHKDKNINEKVISRLMLALSDCSALLPELPGKMKLDNKEALLSEARELLSDIKHSKSNVADEENPKSEHNQDLGVPLDAEKPLGDSSRDTNVDNQANSDAECHTSGINSVEGVESNDGDGVSNLNNDEELASQAMTEALPTYEVQEDEHKEESIEVNYDQVKQAEFDEDMITVFIEEAADLVAEIDSALSTLETNPSNADALMKVQRAMHTLKGGANMSGASYMGDLTHAVESMLENVENQTLEPSVDVFTVIYKAHDAVQEMLDNIVSGEGIANRQDIIDEINAVSDNAGLISRSESSYESDNTAADVNDELSPEDGDSTHNESERFDSSVENDANSTNVSSTEDASKLTAHDNPDTTTNEHVDTEEPYLGETAENLNDATEYNEGDEKHQKENKRVCMPQKDYDVDLFEDAFREEADELTAKLDESFQEMHNGEVEKEKLQLIQRNIHTLKGGANMLSLSPVGELSHEMENVFEKINEGVLSCDENIITLCFKYYDSITDMIDAAKKQENVQYDDELTALIGNVNISNDTSLITSPIKGKVVETSGNIEETVNSSEEVTLANAGVVSDGASGEKVSEKAEKIVTDAKLSQPEKRERRTGSRKEIEQLKVRTDVMSSITDVSGELMISTSRVEQQHNRVMYNIQEMDQVIDRFSDKLRKFSIETESQMQATRAELQDKYGKEFDTLEMDRFSGVQTLTRSMIESLHDIMSIKSMIEETGKDMDTLILQQSRLQGELQSHLVRARTLPFSSHIPRFRKLVRKVAGETNKKADLRITGAEEELDRALLDKIIAPMEHLLRNAVDHGLESTEARLNKNKSETGTVRITVTKEGQEGVISVTDDGAGINTEKVRQKAIKLGLLKEDSSMSDREINQFILHPGFSTADSLTQISGRGVGMDVVNNEIRLMGGSLEIRSESGVGTTFEIRLPLTLAVNRALLVGVNESVYALPISVIDGITYAETQHVAQMHDNPSLLYEYNNASYELHYLGALMGQATPSIDDIDKIPLVLVRAGERRIALHVDALHGNREIVAKPLAKQISSVNGISGATIMGDGRVVMIVDMAAIIRANVLEDEDSKAAQASLLANEVRVPSVMVTDDSITIRKVSERFLTRHGYEVRLAKDGLDALSQIHDEGLPDLMLLDIEMPRMDGFELAQTLLNDEKTKMLPIIMITSRTGEKHKQRAEEIGVKKYLGKPFVEDDLLAAITELLGEAEDSSRKIG